MRRAGRLSVLAAALALACAGPARADDLRAVFEATQRDSDRGTNVHVAQAGFPEASARSLALTEAVRAWLAATPALPARPLVAAAPSKAVRKAAEEVEDWQDATLGSRDSALEKLLPKDLSPSETLAWKLAIERGDDRHTLVHVITNDLEDDPPREALYAFVAEKAAALRRERGGPALRIVNTDVDDTLLPTLWDRGRYARGQAYPGVRALLEGLGEHVVVLTARPGVARPLVNKTRESVVALLGLGDVDKDLAGVSVAPGELLEIVDSLGMGLEKAETLLIERRLFPEAELSFLGDSGQGDWIASLILRDLEPEAFTHAMIHDVRPWSRGHRDLLRKAILESARLERIYRRALQLGDGTLSAADAWRLDAALSRLRVDVERALQGPEGRLDGEFLRTRGIFLFRTHAALALDLLEAGLLSPLATRRVLAAAAPAVRFLPDHPFGFDDGEAGRLEVRLERLAGGK